MRKIFSFILCLGALTQVTGQAAFGVKGGVSFANTRARYLGQRVNTQTTTNFHIGAIFDASLTDNVSLQPELLFSRKGGKGSFLGQNIVVTDRTSYLELPLSLVGKIEAGPGKVFIGAGGYAALLLGGKRETSTRVLVTLTESHSIKIGDDNGDEYRPLDFGLNFKAGYELENGLFLNAAYSLGLSNVQSRGDDNNYLKNAYISLSAGYFFKLD